MATCNVVGELKDGTGEAAVGVFVHAICADSPAILQNTSTGIIADDVNTLTTSTGVFVLPLVRNVNYIVHIPEMGFRKNVRVPDAESVVLWTLTDVVVTGDPTPNDSGDSW